MSAIRSPAGHNPIVRVFVAKISGANRCAMDIGANSDIYIPRVNWLPDSRHIAIQRLNRQQNGYRSAGSPMPLTEKPRTLLHGEGFVLDQCQR